MPSKLHAYAESELCLLANAHPDDELVITPFIVPILALVQAFGESGQSGGSAPFASNAVCSVIKKLLAFKPLSPLTGDDSEWSDVSDFGSEPNLQNARCSSVFKSANGTSYDIDGYVFWHWSERPLRSDEEGYPGTHKYKVHFTSGMSRKHVVFPYVPADPVYVEVDCREVNKETGDAEPGSGWWHTTYPDWIIQERYALDALIGCTSSNHTQSASTQST